jgi:hypothetical protein
MIVLTVVPQGVAVGLFGYTHIYVSSPRKSLKDHRPQDFIEALSGLIARAANKPRSVDRRVPMASVSVQRIVLYSHQRNSHNYFSPTSGTFTRRGTIWHRKRVGSNRDRRPMPGVIG